MIASGTATIAAQKARNSVFHSRPLIDVAISWPLDMAVPRSPVQHAAEPVEIPDIGRVVETELLAQIGERLRRRRLSENGLRDVAGQDLGAGEDQDRNGQQEEDAQRNALGH